MKTTRVILMIGLLLTASQMLRAQVKIGDNPLNLGNERLLEMERAGELFIVTDSLQIGITTSTSTNVPGTDALMMKLYGYGLGNFPVNATTGTLDYFLGTNDRGEVLEFPLTLDLATSPSTATLSLNNDFNLFGQVDMLLLDSVFANNVQLGDSISTIRTLVAANKANDLDTIPSNEFLESQEVINDAFGYQTTLVLYENQVWDDPVPDSSKLNRLEIPLGPYFITYEQVGDTADVLRDNIFYTVDGTLDEDRTVTGAGFDLEFTGIDTFGISSANTILTTTGNTEVTTTGNTDITTTGDLTSTSSTVSVSSTSGDINLTSNDDININAAGDTIVATGVVNINEYTSQPLITDTSSIQNMLGIDNFGNIINVSAATILGTETDSVIYRHDGTLTTDRYMTMAGHNLHFVNGTDTTVITSNGRMAIGRGTVTQGTGTANDIRLDVNGDILAIQVHSSSDERFKKDITRVTGALDKVQSINGVTYNFKTEEFKNKNFPETRQLGFIAQNVEQVVPEVVKTDGAGYKSIDYAKMTALLNEAIKEQQSQIAAQDELIKTQQALLSALTEKYESVNSEMAQMKASIKELSNHTVSEE